MKRAFIPLVTVVVVILLWEALVHLFQLPAYLLPAPSTLVVEISQHWKTLLYHSWITFVESLFGFALGSAIGIVGAFLFVRFPKVKEGGYPLAVLIKSTPIIAIAPLIALWLGNGMFSKIVMAGVICFFPVLVNVVQGLTYVERDFLLLFQSLGAKPKDVLFKLRWPHAMPHLCSALKIGSTVAVIGALIGEFVGAERGLGYVILTSLYHIETASLFSAIVFSALLGLLFFGATAWLEKKLIYWQ